MRRARAALAAAAIAILAPVAPSAEAAPAPAPGGSIWQRMRRPEAARRQDLVAEAETFEIRYHELRLGRVKLDRAEAGVLGDMYLGRAAELLEQAGARTSTDPFLRYRLAVVYTLREQPQKALPLLESVGRADPPAPLRAAVFADLGVTYAHLGRVEDEIKAYGEALRVQPLAYERSRILANRAEAYMLLGDVTSAVVGYRAALALLTSDYLMFGGGPTTLWGLAVALDRSGDLDGGLSAVQLARTYDAQDRHINGPNWFYLPDYDRHWYEALGHWQVARKAGVVLSVRDEAYARATASLLKYVAAATRDDKWLPLARVRVIQCAAEHARFVVQNKIREAPLHDSPGDAFSAPSAARAFFEFSKTLRNKSREEQDRLLTKWILEHGGT
jgi:tetratricopeptide (TPR) repeat protein